MIKTRKYMSSVGTAIKTRHRSVTDYEYLHRSLSEHFTEALWTTVTEAARPTVFYGSVSNQETFRRSKSFSNAFTYAVGSSMALQSVNCT